MRPTKARGKKIPASRSRLLRFLGKFVLFLILLSLLWPFFIPSYNYLIVGAAGKLIPLLEKPSITLIRANGGDILIYRGEPGRGQPVFFRGFTGYIYFGLVPLLALFLATPNLGAVRRIELALIGLTILASFHVIYIIAAVKLSYIFFGLSEVGVAQHYIYGWMEVFLTIIWEAVSVLIWGTLTFKYWLPKPR